MKKSFGQNLLIDKTFLEKIVKAVDVKSDDIVVEIGAGSGLLTILLAEQGKKIFAIEPEKDILKKLQGNINHNKLTNIEIIENSFLKIDLCKLSDKPFKIIGNIPYNLTSKILLKIFGDLDLPAVHLPFVKDVYLMVQSEVAERLVAKAGTKAYSSLSLLIQYFAEPEILFKVPANAFLPKPKIESAFVHLKVKSKLQHIEDPCSLKKIIRTAFQQRRKKIINALERLYPDKRYIEQKFDELNLNHNLRAEDLTFDEYLNICRFTKNNFNQNL